jgi:hypothetical protein
VRAVTPAPAPQLRIHVREVELTADELDRVVRHLDQLWATLAQVVDYVLSNRAPRPRRRVARPAVGRIDVRPPHQVWFHDSDPPAPPALWAAYRLSLTDVGGARDQLERCVTRRREAWTPTERERQDTLLATALAPTAEPTRSDGRPSGSPRDDDLPRLLHRIALHAARVRQAGAQVDP